MCVCVCVCLIIVIHGCIIIIVAPLLRYGKYCGVLYGGCPGEKPCDGLDACCMKHDACIISKQSEHFPLYCRPFYSGLNLACSKLKMTWWFVGNGLMCRWLSKPRMQPELIELRRELQESKRQNISGKYLRSSRCYQSHHRCHGCCIACCGTPPQTIITPNY